MQLIAFIIATVLLAGIIATEPNITPLDCVADADNLTLRAWRHEFPAFDINGEQWQVLTEITGDSVWIGYPDGWNVPNDAIGQWQIDGDIDDSPVSVWVWWSRSTNDYYLFTFDNTTPFADKNGEHYGQHPCGGWRVNRSDVVLPIIEIINDSEGDE